MTNLIITLVIGATLFAMGYGLLFLMESFSLALKVAV